MESHEIAGNAGEEVKDIFVDTEIEEEDGGIDLDDLIDRLYHSDDEGKKGNEGKEGSEGEGDETGVDRGKVPRFGIKDLSSVAPYLVSGYQGNTRTDR